MGSGQPAVRRYGWLVLLILLVLAAVGSAFWWWRQLTSPPFQSLPGAGPNPTALPSFPGAEGAGAVTPGGRGGRVIEVTSLNDGGPGSLREAVDTPGARTIVFRVSGTIELEKPLAIREPYITIAGQTAPGGGITLSGRRNTDGEMILLRDVHDVIIRYLRIRNSARGEPGQGQTNIAIDSGASNILIDHVSMSWSLDENVMIHRNIPDGIGSDAWPEIVNITLQRSIIAEGLDPHSTGTQTGGEVRVAGWRGVHDITIHHNLYVHNSHRNPGIGSLRTQVINNVVYNWSPRVGSTSRDIDVDWIGNYFKPGPMSNPDTYLTHMAFPAESPEDPWPPPSLYLSGNVAPPEHPNPRADNFDLYTIHYTGMPLPDSFRRKEPLQAGGVPVTVQRAYDAYDSVLADVGANARLGCSGGWIENTDSVDRRLLQDVLQGTGPRDGPISHENQVGGVPVLESGEPCPDGDHDGMPDEWELAAGLDPLVDDSSGLDLDLHYSNLEMYLNGAVFEEVRAGSAAGGDEK